MKQNEFPQGWDKEHVQSGTSYHAQQIEGKIVREEASQNEFGMLMEVLTELGPAVYEWILGALVDSQ